MLLCPETCSMHSYGVVIKAHTQQSQRDEGSCTCRSEVNIDSPSAAGGADLATVDPVITPPHAPQQQRGISTGYGVGEDLSSPSEPYILVLKGRNSILILVNQPAQALLPPGDRHNADLSSCLAG